MISADIVLLQDDPGSVLDDFVSALAATEQQEFSGLRYPERQRSFVLSRTLLRHVLAPRLGIDQSTIHFSRAASGRLSLANQSSWQFSLSHSAGLTAVIVAEANCGVDIEVPRSIPFERIARRYFSAAETAWLARCDASVRARDFFRLWTLKEASVKARHEGLAHNLSRLAFDVSGESPHLLDPSLGLQVWQQFDAGVFLAAAVNTAEEVGWQVQKTGLSDLRPPLKTH